MKWYFVPLIDSQDLKGEVDGSQSDDVSLVLEIRAVYQRKLDKIIAQCHRSRVHAVVRRERMKEAQASRETEFEVQLVQHASLHLYNFCELEAASEIQPCLERLDRPFFHLRGHPQAGESELLKLALSKVDAAQIPVEDVGCFVECLRLEAVLGVDKCQPVHD